MAACSPTFCLACASLAVTAPSGVGHGGGFLGRGIVGFHLLGGLRQTSQRLFISAALFCKFWTWAEGVGDVAQ